MQCSIYCGLNLDEGASVSITFSGRLESQEEDVDKGDEEDDEVDPCECLECVQLVAVCKRGVVA
jgi:hypothetical protein